MIGAGRDALDGEDNLDQSAIRLRSDTEGFRIFNALIAEYAEDGLRLDATESNIGDFVTDMEGDFVLAHSYVVRIGDDFTRDDSDPSSMPLPFETDKETWVNVIERDLPAAATGIGVNDFVPDAAIASSFDPSTLSGIFQASTFVGAIDPANDWTLGWVLNADGSVR